jgi:hypothetical protein
VWLTFMCLSKRYKGQALERAIESVSAISALNFASNNTFIPLLGGFLAPIRGAGAKNVD